MNKDENLESIKEEVQPTELVTQDGKVPLSSVNKDAIVELTEKNKEKIIARWNNLEIAPPSIMELVEICFGYKVPNRGGPYVKAIKEFIASRGLRYASKKPVAPTVELTEEKKLFISNHLKDLKPAEMAKELGFEDIAVGVSVIKKYIASLPSNVVATLADGSPEEDESDEYRPPASLLKTTNRIRKYVHDSDFEDIKKIEKDVRLKSCVKSLMSYLHTLRFVRLMNTINNKDDRDLFESSFVRFTYDKDDLTEEDIDLYLNVCMDIVGLIRTQETIDHLRELLMDSSDDSEGRRVSKGLADAIKDAESEKNQNLTRQKTTLGILQGKREDRLKNKIQEQSSVIKLVEAWRDATKREKMLDAANRRKVEINNEIQRLGTLEELKVEIFGLNEESFGS